MKKIIFVSKYPIFSAICAATASFSGKLAFQKENILDDEYSYLLHCIIRAIFFLVMLNLNKFMFQFLFLSWKHSGALLTSSLNFVVNNLLNAFIGFLFFGEIISIKWIYGTLLILIGVALISENEKKF